MYMYVRECISLACVHVFGIHWNSRDGLEWGGKYSVEFTKCVGTFITIYYDDVLRRSNIISQNLHWLIRSVHLKFM